MSDSITTPSKRVTVRRSREEILSLLTAFDQVSDHVDPDVFCRSHNICSGTFYNWRKQERKNGKYSGKPKSYGQFLELSSGNTVAAADRAINYITDNECDKN
ncbi:hypothetical protein [Sphingobacterium athyrii]|uniref:Transposase n=1 Tax=Sphingobacterium athyrii TaxID=2152717 RepID=A0A363NWM4_9SPHI|nr:hypothetical protein [Sphingobacterium athyrii]PUV25113.1 hypothetical protein DCO56_09230 [Sphingobacterium athyrii]